MSSKSPASCTPGNCCLNLKQSFPHDAESRVLEDALCLVFLEHQFAHLARQMREEKMTPAAQALALGLPYDPHQRALLEKTLKALRAL